MDRDDCPIEGAIRAHILKQGRLDPASLGPRTELVEELGMSSLELLGVLAFVEQTYDITIPDEHLVSLTTLARIVAKVKATIAEAGPAPR